MKKLGSGITNTMKAIKMGSGSSTPLIKRRGEL